MTKPKATGTSKDEIQIFIPKTKVRMVILGTMGAICTRTVNGGKPLDVFYYHNPINQFWKVLQYLFEPDREPSVKTVPEKKCFLEKYGIAMSNIVSAIEVSSSELFNPDDLVLFKAHEREKLDFKTASPEFKKILKTAPIFFTCRQKKGIDRLVKGYLKFNDLNSGLSESVWYLPTPTRCSPKARSDVWRNEISNHSSVQID